MDGILFFGFGLSQAWLIIAVIETTRARVAVALADRSWNAQCCGSYRTAVGENFYWNNLPCPKIVQRAILFFLMLKYVTFSWYSNVDIFLQKRNYICGKFQCFFPSLNYCRKHNGLPSSSDPPGGGRSDDVTVAKEEKAADEVVELLEAIAYLVCQVRWEKSFFLFCYV